MDIYKYGRYTTNFAFVLLLLLFVLAAIDHFFLMKNLDLYYHR